MPNIPVTLEQAEKAFVDSILSMGFPVSAAAGAVNAFHARLFNELSGKSYPICEDLPTIHVNQEEKGSGE